ncbi:MAG: glycine betaine ABC transporter substrate-binding protein [Fusobacterium sp.]
MKKFLKIILCASLLIGAVACGSSDKLAKEKKVEINIGQDPYEHEWISVNIIKQLAEERGYKINIVEGDIGFMFLGLAQGDIDIYPDVWIPVLHKSYMDKYEGKIELVGTLTKEIPLGMAVPSYTNFDSIADIKDNADAIGNRIVGVEPSAGMMLTAEKTLEAYDLKDSIKLLDGSTPAMLAELDKSIKLKEPMVFLAWRPHTMFIKYDIKILDDPKGIWSFDNDEIGVNLKFKEKAPDIYKFLQHFTLSIEETEAMLIRMEEENISAEDLASEWITEHRDEIDSYFSK